MENNLLPFLPMLYVAWSDAIIDTPELEAIRQKMQEQEWLLAGERKLLGRWIDPTNPPAPGQMQIWLKTIREAAADLGEAPRQSLAELGVQIASGGSDERCLSPESCAALEEIEQALGVLSADAVQALIADEVRPLRPLVERETPSFNIEAMQMILDRDNPAVKNGTRQILTEKIFAQRDFESLHDHREATLVWSKHLADHGLGSLAYPESAGGKDDMGAYLAVMEMIAHHDMSLLIKFGVQFGLFGGSISLLGTARHHQKYLRDVGTLALPGCFAMTELGHGSNVRELETIATFDKATQEFVIHTPSDQARKEYIGNSAAHGRMATVFAQLEIDGERYGINAFLVPIRDDDNTVLPGVRIQDNGHKLGLNGVDNGRLWFEHVRILRENMLNRFADVTPEGEYVSDIAGESKRFFTMIGTLVGGRVGIGLSANSVAKNGLTIAIRYANRRRQFGPAGEPETPLIDYQTHQKRLMPLLANAYALDFALKYLTERYVNRTEKDSREVETLAAGLKSFSTWNATDTLQEGREACGGMGYMARNRFAALKADSDIFTTFEGDNTVLMQLVAKGRLTDFKKQFEDSAAWGMVKFVAQQAARSLVDHNPISIRRTDSDHLRDSSWHLDMFQHREEAMVVAVSQRLRSLIRQGMKADDAVVGVQNDLVAMAHAWVEYVILQQFVKGVEAMGPSAEREILQKLAQLFALTHIEKNAAWYLEHGDLSGAKSIAIRREAEALANELSGQALYLVDAFGIPDATLAAPIGLR